MTRSERQASLAELYLARYPKGAHVDDAKALIASLRATEEESSSPEFACERLATHPHDATAGVNGVEMESLKKNAEAAVQFCGQAAEDHPEIAHYQALLARAAFAAGRYDEGVALYRKAADANDVRAMVSLGLCSRRATTPRRTSRRPMRSMRKRLTAAAPTARSTSLWRSSRARGSTLTFLARLPSSKRPPTAARPALPTTSPPSSRAAWAASRRAKRSPSFGAPQRRAIRRPIAPRPCCLTRVAECPKDPAAAAEDLLRAVATDAGETRAELTGKNQTWTAETVRQLQTRLKSARYYAGPIDGKTGAAIGPALTQWRLLGGAPPSP